MYDVALFHYGAALRSVAFTVAVLSRTVVSTSNLARLPSPRTPFDDELALFRPLCAACRGSSAPQWAAELGRGMHEASGTACQQTSPWLSMRLKQHSILMSATSAGTVTSTQTCLSTAVFASHQCWPSTNYWPLLTCLHHLRRRCRLHRRHRRHRRHRNHRHRYRRLPHPVLFDALPLSAFHQHHQPISYHADRGQ